MNTLHSGKTSYTADIQEITYQYIGSDTRLGTEHHDNSIEIFQMWSEGGFFIVKGNIFPIIPGSIIIANAMEPHYSNPSRPDTYNRSKIIISQELFGQILTLCGLKDHADEKVFRTGGLMLPLASNSATTLEIDTLFKRAAMNFPIRQASCSNQAIIIDCIIRILVFAFYLTPDNISSLNNDKDVKTSKTIALLTEYLNRPIESFHDFSLDGLCQYLHISKSHASHIFKNLTNKSISQYVMELRISEAKKLLLNTDLKILDIAERLNFHDSTTFCKTFKKHVHCTPNDYRNSKGISLSTPE